MQVTRNYRFVNSSRRSKLPRIATILRFKVRQWLSDGKRCLVHTWIYALRWLYFVCSATRLPTTIYKVFNNSFFFHAAKRLYKSFFQSFYNTAVALYYRDKFSEAIQTLDHLKEQQLPDNLFFIRLQLRLLRTLCLYKLTKSQETAIELASLLKVIFKISPAFGRRWKDEFHFYEPTADSF